MIALCCARASMALGLFVATARAAEWEPPLHGPAYRFCNDPGADAEGALAWCELLDDAPADRCPGLRATCEDGERRAESVVDQVARAAGCNPPGGSSGFSAPPAPPPMRPAEGCDLGTTPPPAAGCGGGTVVAALRWTLALIVAVCTLLVARAVIAWFGRSSAPEGPEPARVPRAPVVATHRDELPDLPSDDLLDLGRRAIADGRFGDAVMFARGAALRRLADRGRVVLHRSRTDREYVRQVRTDADVHDAMREVVGAAEVYRWGNRAVLEGTARAALRAAERVVAALATSMVLLAVPREAEATRHDAQGDAALFDLFANAGYDVSWRLRGLDSLDATTDVVILDLSIATGIDLDDADRGALRGWVEAGGVAVIGGDAPRAFHEFGTTVVPAAFGTSARLAPGAPADLPIPHLPFGPAYGYATDGQPVAWVVADFAGPPTPMPVVAVLPLGSGAVVGVADGRLFDNGALVSPRNEAFWIDLPWFVADAGLADLDIPARVEIATHAGEEATDPFTSLSNARLLPFVLQFLAFGALVALWRGAPLAPLRDPPSEGRIVFADHARALGAHYARLGASRRALAALARLWLGRLGPDGLLRTARRAGWDADQAAALVRNAEDAAAEPGPDRPERDLSILEELWRITRRP